MQYCHSCIPKIVEPAEKDRLHYHYWAAIGHDFKSEITNFYKIARNTNGKMSKQAYINQILEPVVKS